MALLQYLDLRTFLIVALIFIPLERLFSLHEQRVFRRGWKNDLVYQFVNRLPIQLGLVVVIGITLLVSSWLVPPIVRQLVADQPVWLQVVEAIILSDIGFYLAHRMFHSVPWLWRFHAVHHSIEELDWLAGARVHPIDQIVTKGASLIPLFALGYSDSAIGIYATIYFWHSLLLHANVRMSFGPLRWLIASPEFHHWHHANEREAWDKNFGGQLAILDKLFGTMHMPKGRLPMVYGVDQKVPSTYVPQLVYPFKRRQKRKVAKTVPGPAIVRGSAETS